MLARSSKLCSNILLFGAEVFTWSVFVWGTLTCAYAGGLPVIDAALIQETLTQRTLTMQQWAQENETRLQQLYQLGATHNLLQDQTLMPYQDSWQSFQNMHEQSLALVHATQALWREYGSIQNYYTAYLKAEAWEMCISTGNCDFNQALQNLDQFKLQQANQAATSAEKVNQQLDSYVTQLQQLSFEAQNSQSIASTLDTLTKITSNVDSLLITLNSQIATLSALQSQEAGQRAWEKKIERKYIQAISQHADTLDPWDMPNKIP